MCSGWRFHGADMIENKRLRVFFEKLEHFLDDRESTCSTALSGNLMAARLGFGNFISYSCLILTVGHHNPTFRSMSLGEIQWRHD